MSNNLILAEGKDVTGGISGLAAEGSRDQAADDLAAALGDSSVSALVPDINKAKEPSVPAADCISDARSESSKVFWGDSMLHALQSTAVLISCSKVAAMACTAEQGQATIYCALTSGALKVFNGSTGSQV